MLKNLLGLLDGKKTKLPIYDYVTHSRQNHHDIVSNAEVIILEGLYALYDEQINKLANLKIFVNTPKDECFIRRLLRDVKERGRSLDSVISQWRKTVVPMYNAFIEPLKQKADIIIPWYETNKNGINIIRHGLRGICSENELLSKK